MWKFLRNEEWSIGAGPVKNDKQTHKQTQTQTQPNKHTNTVTATNKHTKVQIHKQAEMYNDMKS